MRETVLVVDDHPSFRRFARRVLEAAGFRVVGEASDGASALLAVRELGPEVILLDILLPDANGFDVAEEIAARGAGPTRVVLISSRDASDYGALIDSAPAVGFIPKAELTADALVRLLAT